MPKLDETFTLRGKEVRSTWEEDFQALHVEENFAGVLQAAVGADVRLRASYGYAQRRYKIKNTFFTAFNLGSGRDFFAEAALRRLAERGAIDGSQINPEADPSEVLEELTGKRTWRVVSEEVLVPAELSQTAYYYLDQLPARAASGYTFTNAGGRRWKMSMPS